jgi:hypothetical protein
MYIVETIIQYMYKKTWKDDTHIKRTKIIWITKLQSEEFEKDKDEAGKWIFSQKRALKWLICENKLKEIACAWRTNSTEQITS